MRQARAGRVVMSVDSTDLLNRRHVATKDDGCLSQFPVLSAEHCNEMTFDDVVVYSADAAAVGSREQLLTDLSAGRRTIKAVLVTYGNGVPTSLLAVKNLFADSASADGLLPEEVLVVDCPYLSAVPAQLTELLTAVHSQNPDFSLLCADVCKESGNMPLHQYTLTLQREALLPRSWSIIGAANTYNPLSRTLTFLNETSIREALLKLTRR